ncbi:hypothetical protein DFR60_1305 [Hungatella effluvii]|uniref:Uncharacterized protein n=1 Tax=Hungatella effluvii TaxID=1096246 RepID=A0A2V3XVI0_9FIRM|nr:hypothetical protein DFR60_1305 [Hungatella effluvii]
MPAVTPINCRIFIREQEGGYDEVSGGTWISYKAGVGRIF